MTNFAQRINTKFLMTTCTGFLKAKSEDGFYAVFFKTK